MSHCRPAATADAAVPATLQRACACSSAAGIAGRCPSCAAKQRLGVPPKLRINPPGDRWEQEAERIAEQVVAERPSPLTGPLPITPLVQRQPEEEEPLQASGGAAPRSAAVPGPAFARAVSAECAGGRPLDNVARSYFEPRFGRELSAVRLHDGPRAASLNRQIGAGAFTLGNHIFLGAGGLDPAATSGRRLLAHELAHTLQQGADRVVQRAPDDRPESDSGAAANPENEEPDVYGTDRIDVHGTVTIRGVGQTKVDAIETPVGPLYPGDTVYMQVRVEGREVTGEPHVRDIMAPVDWTLPAGDLELAERLSKSRSRLRVISDPASLIEPRTVEATVDSDALRHRSPSGSPSRPRRTSHRWSIPRARSWRSRCDWRRAIWPGMRSRSHARGTKVAPNGRSAGRRPGMNAAGCVTSSGRPARRTRAWTAISARSRASCARASTRSAKVCASVSGASSREPARSGPKRGGRCARSAAICAVTNADRPAPSRSSA